jgi:hypothetical protein
MMTLDELLRLVASREVPERSRLRLYVNRVLGKLSVNP